MIAPMDPDLIRIIGYGYELPPLPVRFAAGWAIEIKKRPDYVALSVNGGPILIAREA